MGLSCTCHVQPLVVVALQILAEFADAFVFQLCRLACVFNLSFGLYRDGPDRMAGIGCVQQKEVLLPVQCRLKQQ